MIVFAVWLFNSFFFFFFKPGESPSIQWLRPAEISGCTRPTLFASQLGAPVQGMISGLCLKSICLLFQVITGLLLRSLPWEFIGETF